MGNAQHGRPVSSVKTTPPTAIDVASSSTYRRTTGYRNPHSARANSTVVVGDTSEVRAAAPTAKRCQQQVLRRAKTAHDKQRNSMDEKMFNLCVDDTDATTTTMTKRKSSAHLSQSSIASVGSKSPDPVIMKEFLLTQLQIRQLQRIWLTVRAKGSTFAAEAVFTSVFSRTPGARATISPNGDTMQLTRRLYVPWTTLMDTAISRLAQPEMVARELEQLGARHAIYRDRGFHPSWLTTFAECMTQQALQWGTRQQRNSGTQEAWTKLVMFIVHHMRDGYYAKVKDNAERSAALKAQLSVGIVGSDDDDEVVQVSSVDDRIDCTASLQKTRRARSTDSAMTATSSSSTGALLRQVPLVGDLNGTTPSKSPRSVKFTTGPSSPVDDDADEIEAEGSTVYEDTCPF